MGFLPWLGPVLITRKRQGSHSTVQAGRTAGPHMGNLFAFPWPGNDHLGRKYNNYNPTKGDKPRIQALRFNVWITPPDHKPRWVTVRIREP